MSMDGERKALLTLDPTAAVAAGGIDRVAGGIGIAALRGLCGSGDLLLRTVPGLNYE